MPADRRCPVVKPLRDRIISPSERREAGLRLRAFALLSSLGLGLMACVLASAPGVCFSAGQFEALYLRGLVLQRNHQLRAAEDAFRAALKINPVSPEATYFLAQVLDEEGRYSAEVHCLERLPLAGLSGKTAYRLQFAEAAALAENNQFGAAASLFSKLASRWPASVEVHAALASLYAHHDRYDASAAEYKTVLKLDPSNRVARLSLSKVLLMGNHLQESLPYLVDYVQRSPNDAEGHEILGEVFERLGQPGYARKEFLRSSQLNPANYKSHYQLGLVLKNLGNVRQAIAELQVAKRLNPRASDVLYELARMQAGQKDSGAANENLQAYERLERQEQAGEDARNLNDLAVRSLRVHQWGAAATACRKAIRLDPGQAEFHYNLSLALSHLGDVAAEREELEEAARLNPKFAKAHNRLGLMYLALGKPADAEREFKAAIQADPQFSEAKNNLGVLYGREGKVQGAVREFQEATLDNPQYAQAFLNWGLVLASAGQYASAEKTIQRAVQISSANADAYLALGMTELELHHMDQSVTAYKKATALEPDRFDARLQLGLALAEQKHLEEALNELSHAVRLNPASAMARYQEARVLYGLGRSQEARAEAERACQILPNYREAIRLLALINRENGSRIGDH